MMNLFLKIKKNLLPPKIIKKKVIKIQKDIGLFEEFLTLARYEMDKNDLYDWGLELDFAKVRAGACHFGEKKITFSRNFLKNSNQHDIKDTILHEIAHALVGSNNGHNKVWKEMAIKLGCSAKRCHTLEFSDYKWTRFCPNQCWEQKTHRRKSNLICKKCGSTVSYKVNSG